MRTRTALSLLLLLPAAASAQGLGTAISAAVRISGTKGGTPVRGSGFVVGLDRDKATIVTASHVIEGVKHIQVTFAADPSESFPAGRTLGMDAGSPHGLAAFQVRGAIPGGVTLLSFEVASQPSQGDELFMVGFPEMAPVPRTPRRVLAARSGTLLLIDQGVGESFSGGPVLQGGKVVGVVTGSDDQTTYAVIALVARASLEGWGGKLGGQRSTHVTSAATPTKPVSPKPKTCVPGAGEELTENGITYVRICGGTFTMGSAANDPQAFHDEKPAHQVKLSEFWIGKTEITNEQYRRVRQDQKGEANLPVTDEQYRRFHQDQKGEANLPVTDISWTEAKAACEHFGGRLPTEAEWEYAARAGSQTSWSFGDDEKMLGTYTWYGENSGGETHPVGTKKANAWGLHDMHGNAMEWVADWYDDAYPSAAQTDPSGPLTGKFRVQRGGAFNFSSRHLRSAFRSRGVPEDRDWGIGFRCARGPRRQP